MAKKIKKKKIKRDKDNYALMFGLLAEQSNKDFVAFHNIL